MGGGQNVTFVVVADHTLSLACIVGKRGGPDRGAKHVVALDSLTLSDCRQSSSFCYKRD